jgi:hypothetical protein
MITKRIAIRIIIVTSLVLLGSYAALPCTCLRISHRKEFRQTEIIFTGKVIEITEDKSFVPPKLTDPNLSPESLARLQRMVDKQKRYLITFSIDRGFKGTLGKEVVFDKIESESPCAGIDFDQGETYLVYASREDHRVYDNGLCSRTTKLDVTSKEYKELGSFWFRLTARFL